MDSNTSNLEHTAALNLYYALMWVLGTKPGSSERAAIVFMLS